MMFQKIKHMRHIMNWRLKGRPVPPPHIVKQRTIRNYQRQSGYRVFIETGTYLGDMVSAQRPHFKLIYSIELSEELSARARDRFLSYPQIHILQGNSSDVLPEILKYIEEPCIFWLDGHFSAGITAQGPLDYPILDELREIGQHPIKNHLLLIDDARLFLGTANAPSQETIREAILKINPKYRVELRDDIIRAVASFGARA